MLQENSSVVILGIDPGYDRVGWCVAQIYKGETKLLKFGGIQTSKKESLMQRYQQIDAELQKIVDEFHPSEAALESLFFENNQKTAMHVSEARGVILSTLFRQHVEIFEYTPLQMKQAVTGYGKAEKTAVEKMLRLQFHLGDAKILDDVIDAIGMTLTHAAQRVQQKLQR